MKLIADNRDAMDAIIDELIEKESLSGDEFRDVLSQYAKIPDVNLLPIKE